MFWGNGGVACIAYSWSRTTNARPRRSLGTERYARENNLEFQVSWERSALGATSGDAKFDLIFMDIGLPGINGMEAATLIRTYDSETPIIFVTNLAQYAVRGYEVDALDFVVKPVSYYNFKMRMDKAMRILKRNSGMNVVVTTHDGLRVIPAAELVAVEVSNHNYSLPPCGWAYAWCVAASRRPRRTSLRRPSCASRTAACSTWRTCAP